MSEFSGIDWEASLDTAILVAVRLTVAAAFAALVGFEREAKGRAAGLRTHILVGIGSALFTLVPVLHGDGEASLEEIVKGIAAGIGFLGAGTILKRASGHSIRGLTTAAGIWFTAAIGMSVGAGLYVPAAIGTAFAFLTLYALSFVEPDGGDDGQEDPSRGDRVKGEGTDG